MFKIILSLLVFLPQINAIIYNLMTSCENQYSVKNKIINLEYNILHEFNVSNDGYIIFETRDKISSLNIPDCIIEEDIEITPTFFNIFPLNYKTKFHSNWGLDRINQRNLPLDYFTKNDIKEKGENVNTYVLDTGVYHNQDEFDNRLQNGIRILNNSFICNDHGSHVAGIIGSKHFGVANKVNIINVPIFKCKNNSTISFTSTLVIAFSWILDDCTKNSKKCIINLSILGGNSIIINKMITSLYEQNIISVCAAGNFNKDACEHSPANVPACITVASLGSDDILSSFSNFGSCVNISAPGSGIYSTKNGKGGRWMSGTSMATPHVVGALALLWSKNYNFTNKEIIEEMYSLATKDKIKHLSNNTINLMLYIPPNPNRNFYIFITILCLLVFIFICIILLYFIIKKCKTKCSKKDGYSYKI